jgi:hypothetical protein
MNINELFETIQDEFDSEDINGEYLLFGNVIIWSYNITENSEELEFINEDDEEEIFNFEASSSEELLEEAYQSDFDKLQELLDRIEETEWTFSDSEIVDDVISFKIF